MRIIVMIPARLGSQRLKQKNLQQFNGEPLIVSAIRKAKDSCVFDEIWVNSEDKIFERIAHDEGVNFHKRPYHLADNNATSEDYVYEFFKAHECDYMVQLHSIAPLLRIDDLQNFVWKLQSANVDTLLSVEDVKIECAFKNNPINFSYDEKLNSQKLTPIQRITWSITGWKRDTYLSAYESEKCATYSGEIGYFSIDKLGAHIIKTQEDLNLANVLSKVFNR